MKKSHIILATLALAVGGYLVIAVALRKFHHSTRHIWSSKVNIAVVREAERKILEDWKKKYGHIHPRATLLNANIDPKSNQLVIRIRAYTPSAPGDADSSRGAVSFFLNGQLQSQSIYDLGGADFGVLTFELKSKGPVISGYRYQLEVLDRNSGDRQKRIILFRNGKALWK